MTDVAGLVEARYGSATQELPHLPANQTLETILSHRSVRHFLPDPVSPETLQTIIAAAQSAPTSSNLQTWSVVVLRDAQIRHKVAGLSANQAFIRDAPLFLVFCADLNRLTRVSQRLGKPAQGLEFTEMFLVASVDAALAAQNALTAAESLGLGACYVGAIRNNAHEIADLLNLPDRVIALFGMAIGSPDPEYANSVKPRLPQSQVVHLDTWKESDSGISEYDDTLTRFNAGQNREGVSNWTQAASARVADLEALSGRHLLHTTLTARGFNLR